jgi:hypothetical protein
MKSRFPSLDGSIAIALIVRGSYNSKRGRARLGGKYNLAANSVQTKPNKTKQKGLDFLVFPWIYSSELGLFNGYSESK